MLVRIYPENPNQKEIDKVVKVLQDGGLVVYPTDTVYAIGCDALNVRAVEKICQMKGVNPQKSNLSIICYDLSNLSEYAKVSNAAFKLILSPLSYPPAASFQRFTRTGKKSESVYRTITLPVHWYNPWEIQS